jgi:hypothetical protein
MITKGLRQCQPDAQVQGPDGQTDWEITKGGIFTRDT